MRIGLVCPYSFDVPGGVQNQVRDLASVLHDRGHAVAVLAPGEHCEGMPPYVELVGKAVAVPYNGAVGRLAFGPRVSARTTRWLQRGEFDLVHVHEPIVPSVSLLALWAAVQPVVATFHTANTRSRTMASMSPIVRPSLEKLAARIAVSEAARSTLVQHMGGEPVVIPNGLFVEAMATTSLCERWQSPGPVVTFLGRFDEPRKGLAVLLDAWSDIRAALPTCRLLVAGPGEPPDGFGRPGPDALRAEVAPGRDGIEYLGQLSDDDRATLLRSATVYVAPHVAGESFGIVLAEAMAAGTAVVASDLPAFRALLQDGAYGRLFAAGDPAALARAVVDLVKDAPAREELERRASDAVHRYDWSTVAEEIVAVYDTALSAARHTPPGLRRGSATRPHSGNSRDAPLRP